MHGGRRRIAMYWHAGHSLGHTVRNAVLARAFTEADPAATVVGLTRARCGLEYLPDAVDVVKLPELDARQPPEVMARRVRGPVSDLKPERVARMRRSLVRAFMETFDPTACVVDYHPFGRDDELREAIRAHRYCKWILGLRGFIQSPARTALSHFAGEKAAEIAELYSAIWVYADRRVVDLQDVYGVPEALASMMSYPGYVTRARSDGRMPNVDEVARPLVVIAFGGGKRMDGLMKRAADAAINGSGGTVVVFAGPWADPRELAALRRRDRDSDRLRVLTGSRDLHAWLRAADLFIGKGGYNTLAEVLATGCNAIVVSGGPGTVEQALHSERLAQGGFVRLVDADELQADDRRAARLVAGALDDRYPKAGWSPEVDGARRCARILEEMLSHPPGS
jgi:predicted glycosyltransferase